MVESATRSKLALGHDELYPGLGDPVLSSMNFLNEVAERYPDAVSFAAGRPYEEFLDVRDLHHYLDTYCSYLRDEMGLGHAELSRTVMQYGRTKGVIHELVARCLARDEGMAVDSEAVVVTVGAQEALLLLLRALKATDDDAVLAVSPTYVGFMGAARLMDMPVLPVRDGAAGIDLDDLEAVLARARATGIRLRACYVTPDFANPTGASLDLVTRRRLLDIAERERLLLVEDNPYGIFRAGAERLPTLKALDDAGVVVYVSTFAKTGVPGARVGFLVADQPVTSPLGGTALLADELAKVKSMVTLNTAPVAQAVIGGKLLAHGMSLVDANRAEIEVYRRNLRRLLDGLSARFADRPDVTWNTPGGGFFVVLTVPFVADERMLEMSAERHGVLWTPMTQFFHGAGGGAYQLRLSVSVLTPEQIDSGLDRLAALVREQEVAA